jgi:hypothetical protein
MKCKVIYKPSCSLSGKRDHVIIDLDGTEISVEHLCCGCCTYSAEDDWLVTVNGNDPLCKKEKEPLARWIDPFSMPS